MKSYIKKCYLCNILFLLNIWDIRVLLDISKLIKSSDYIDQFSFYYFYFISKYRAELKEISIKKDNAQSNDIESSIYNAFSNKTAKINQNSRRKFSDSRRIEDSKFYF